ncbi:hypothetical protein [Mycobacterium malmoense]|uniref:hypothetical protein n=1 Tax=Mycobacterium malmoense TaxID=1780 RepID=UPI00114D4C63|nr:hypothetical protein [Mycobacterium malmoense]
MSWIDGDQTQVKRVSKAIGDAWSAMDRLYYHSHTNEDIIENANAVSAALRRVRAEARRNRNS